MLTLYDYLPSGNGYKVRLLLHQLQIPFNLETLAIWDGTTRTQAFLAKNPNGRIPTLTFDDGRHLWESHAIIWHLAQNSAFLPDAPWAQAKVMQWLCFEQYEVEPAIGVIRARLMKSDDTAAWQHLYDACREKGLRALSVLDAHLENKAFMVDDTYSIADIALYGYVHVADEARFDLQSHPHITAWMARIRQQPRHIPITWRP